MEGQSGDFAAEIEALGAVLAALQPLTSTQRAFVVQTASLRLGIAAPALPQPRSDGLVNPIAQPTPNAASDSDNTVSPKAFLRKKQPETEIQRVVCLAYYLAHYRDLGQFKTADITKLNTEAAQPLISNPSHQVKRAQGRYGFVVAASGGKKQISALGEELVAALPDQLAAKAVLKNNSKRKSRKTTTGRGARRTSKAKSS